MVSIENGVVGGGGRGREAEAGCCGGKHDGETNVCTHLPEGRYVCFSLCNSVFAFSYGRMCPSDKPLTSVLNDRIPALST